MFQIVQVITILLVAVAMALSLAHALEFFGKMRLDEVAYRTTQTIYYPGFTVGGVSEPAGALATFVLLLMTPGDTAFWLILGALLALVAMHAIFWLVTQPVNKHWVKGVELGAAGTVLFNPGARESEDWTRLRDCWEYSHIARGVLATVALIFLLVAVTTPA